MQGFVFEFAFDASGSPDAITLPHDFPVGMRRIILKPPIGHAWTFYGEGSTGHPLQMDEPVELKREPAQASFQAGETIGRAALDTGSGNGGGLAS